MSLPKFKSEDLTLQLMQSKWASQLDPILNNPISNPLLIKDIVLVTGANIINHRLGRAMQGWVVTDIDAPVSLYRSAPLNQLTLTLTASGPATISLAVY